MNRALPKLPHPEILLGGVLYLMTKHAQTPCPSLRRAIAEHLRWLSRHPSTEIAAGQRLVYARLAGQWEQLAVDTMTANPAMPASYGYAAASGLLQ